jgi:aryl-alcohol dehydrogenase-like predicted oxidoreductase
LAIKSLTKSKITYFIYIQIANGVRFEIFNGEEKIIMTDTMINLGRSGIEISRLGLGTMQWGDIEFTDQPGSNIDQDIQGVYQVSLDSGINFYDTAEVYGSGRSELYLGRYLKELTDKVIVATKFMPYPWRLSKGEFRSALLRSLKRLGLQQVDLYQMHWPIPPISISSWMEAMADAVASGLVRAVGVSNYSSTQTKKAFDALARHNIPLASNQVRYNLLHRQPENNGLVDLCKELGITIIAYSPLEKGILTGKYSHVNMPQGFLAWRYNKNYLNKIDPIIEASRQIGEIHGGKAPAAVALNWLICKGVVPIPGARNPIQARENADALGWQLTNDEVNRLEEISY